MYELTFKHDGEAKLVCLAPLLSQDDLLLILGSVFPLARDPIGITDARSNFYDIGYVALNIKFLHGQHLTIVTAAALAPSGVDKDCWGVIVDIDAFTALFKASERTVVVCSRQEMPGVGFPYLWAKHSQESIRIYQHGLFSAIFPVSLSWPFTINAVKKYLTHFLEEKEASSKQSLINFQLFQDTLRSLLEEGLLNELEYYKMKVRLHENPQSYARKYANCKKGDLYSRMKTDVLKRFDELQIYESIINVAGTRKHEIPIIVSKSNNVIETFTTSYPLSIQQEQALNMLFELQLKGLASQKDTGLFKKYILQDDKDLFSIFQRYCNEEIDQLQLCTALREKVKQLEDNKQIGKRILLAVSASKHQEKKSSVKRLTND